MSQPVQRKWRRPKVWVPIALILFLLMAAVVLRTAARSGVKRQMEAIREAGLPADALALDEWYERVPVDENGALAILDATYAQLTPAAGKNPNDNSMGEFPTHGPVLPKLADAIRDYAGANVAAIEKLEEAVSLSGTRYPIEITKGAATLLPHLATVKHSTMLMKWAAVQSSLDGKPEEALRRLKTGFGIAASLAPEPLLISELVRMACVSIMLPAVERLVNDHQLSIEQAVELDELLRKTEEEGHKAIYRAMVGERAIGVSHFDMSYKEFEQMSNWGGGPTGESPLTTSFKALLFNFRRASGLADRDKAFYLQVTGWWVRAMRMDFPEMLRECEKVDDYLQTELGKHRTRYLISGMMLPQMARSSEKEVLLAARLRCARMALAIEKFRAANSGKLPSLADLQPEYFKDVPRDPADGRDLEYRLAGNKGYEVQAVASTSLANEGRTKTNALAAGFRVVR